MILAMLLLLAQSASPQWRDRAIICTNLQPWENDVVGILEMNSIRYPGSNWRRTASQLLAREDFHGKIFVATLLARHDDYSGWQYARDEFLFRIVVRRDSAAVISALAAFWKMTTPTDPNPGAALRELEELALGLKNEDRKAALQTLADFDPGGWVRKP